MTRLRVFTVHGDVFYLEPEYDTTLQLAVDAYIESGGYKDALLSLRTIEGGTVTLCASVIYGWSVTTAETERKWRELSHEWAREEVEHLEELAGPEWEQ